MSTRELRVSPLLTNGGFMFDFILTFAETVDGVRVRTQTDGSKAVTMKTNLNKPKYKYHKPSMTNIS